MWRHVVLWSALVANTLILAGDIGTVYTSGRVIGSKSTPAPLLDAIRGSLRLAIGFGVCRCLLNGFVEYVAIWGVTTCLGRNHHRHRTRLPQVNGGILVSLVAIAQSIVFTFGIILLIVKTAIQNNSKSACLTVPDNQAQTETCVVLMWLNIAVNTSVFFWIGYLGLIITWGIAYFSWNVIIELKKSIMKRINKQPKLIRGDPDCKCKIGI